MVKHADYNLNVVVNKLLSSVSVCSRLLDLQSRISFQSIEMKYEIEDRLGSVVNEVAEVFFQANEDTRKQIIEQMNKKNPFIFSKFILATIPEYVERHSDSEEKLCPTISWLEHSTFTPETIIPDGVMVVISGQEKDKKIPMLYYADNDEQRVKLPLTLLSNYFYWFYQGMSYLNSCKQVNCKQIWKPVKIISYLITKENFNIYNKFKVVIREIETWKRLSQLLSEPIDASIAESRLKQKSSDRRKSSELFCFNRKYDPFQFKSTVFSLSDMSSLLKDILLITDITITEYPLTEIHKKQEKILPHAFELSDIPSEAYKMNFGGYDLKSLLVCCGCPEVH